MANDGYETRNESGEGPSVSASGPENSGDRRTTFGYCHNTTGGAEAGFPCGAIVRRHPVIFSVIVALMGLTCLAMATVMIAGVLRCFRVA